jgi:uncharacterized protein (TIGR02001 family)
MRAAGMLRVRAVPRRPASAWGLLCFRMRSGRPGRPDPQRRRWGAGKGWNSFMIRKIAAVAFGLGLLAAPASAQVELGSGFTATGTITAATDYVFRNISQTRNRPAVQGSVELSHEIGLYVGAFGSNVAFPNTNARQEVDLIAGYRRTIGSFTFDIGGTWYTYPGYSTQEGQFGLSYAEAILKLKYELDPVTFVGTAAYSPNFFGSSGDGYWIEGGIDWKTPVLDAVLSGRVGYQWIERNARFGAPDYLAYSVYLTVPIRYGFSVGGGFYGTNVSQADCAGLKVCDNRFIGFVTWTF